MYIPEPNHTETFTTKNFLSISERIHNKTKRVEDKKYSCSFCDFKFVQMNKLKMHLRTHTNEKREFI